MSKHDLQNVRKASDSKDTKQIFHIDCEKHLKGFPRAASMLVHSICPFLRYSCSWITSFNAHQCLLQQTHEYTHSAASHILCC